MFRLVKSAPATTFKARLNPVAATALTSQKLLSATKSKNNMVQISRSRHPKSVSTHDGIPNKVRKTSVGEDPAREISGLERPVDLDHTFIGKTGGQIFHEMLARQNVDRVFGYAGGAILPVLDAMYESKHIEYVLPKHEQSAGHMAEGYAKATGKPGVVLVTSGPGATNMVTPMQDALMDGVPLVVFTGQVATSHIGTDAFQEADMMGISRPCTKWNVIVKNVAELPKRINEAFEIATSGRPGPVLVDLPKDVTAGVLQHAIPVRSTLPSNALSHITRPLTSRFTREAIKRSADLLNQAEKPVLLVGAGIFNDARGPNLVKRLADKVQIPVVTTILGLGAYDQSDEKSLDFLGMHGSAAANSAIQSADLIIALGARFDDRATGNVNKFAPTAKAAAEKGKGGIIQFEISPKNINKIIETTEAIEGDVTTNLITFLSLVDEVKDRSKWLKQVKSWKAAYPYSYTKETPGSRIMPQSLIREISQQTKNYDKEVIVTTGVGQHQMWTAQHFEWKTPRSFITSGGLGTMGFGLPAAIGAQLAKPDAMVIDIDGDASFNMSLTELSSAVQAGAPVKICIMNNEEQGMITQWQSLFFENKYMSAFQLNPDFLKLADAMGIEGIRVTNQEQLKAGVTKFLDCKGPVLMEVLVEKLVPVLPMVVGASGLDEFVLHDANAEKRELLLRNKSFGPGT